jgi:ribosome biogenesis GTPase
VSLVNDTGLVIAAHGRRGVLETKSGTEHPFLVRSRAIRPVCGDRVSWTREQGQTTAVVNGIAERDNQLERMAPYGRRVEVLAANLTCVLVVVAPRPDTDWFLTDRYFCAAAVMGCDASLVVNKQDLHAELAPEGRHYAKLGCSILQVSAETGAGLDGLVERLTDQIGILVGQSGVGKSSLINRLIPGADAAVGQLSTTTREGRHTTSASIMHVLPNGGRLIDTPGVREFIPAIHDPQWVQAGFAEVVRVAEHCRFNNCRHLREPDCAVKHAVEDGTVDPRRYESYKRLLRSIRVER